MLLLFVLPRHYKLQCIRDLRGLQEIIITKRDGGLRAVFPPSARYNITSHYDLKGMTGLSPSKNNLQYRKKKR